MKLRLRHSSGPYVFIVKVQSALGSWNDDQNVQSVALVKMEFTFPILLNREGGDNPCITDLARPGIPPRLSKGAEYWYSGKLSILIPAFVLKDSHTGSGCENKFPTREACPIEDMASLFAADHCA